MKTQLHHDDFFAGLRTKEFAILDEQKQTYLDFTGGNLSPRSLLDKHCHTLQTKVMGNPHSTNPTSQTSTHLVEETRQKILTYFNATDYYCVFTQNASAALKIIGESYPFDEKSHFLILSDNHNSVNGIREFCTKKKGTVRYIPVEYRDLQIHPPYLDDLLIKTPKHHHNLFAFPAQSNVSGVKHDLGWIKKAQDHGFDVLLDAAAFVPSNKLDLSVHKPEFVSVSFYKMFGFPTGIGCLLIKKSVFQKLIKPWFAGGTVSLVSVIHPNRFLANNHERFEDGTLNYQMIPAVKNGLEWLESIGIQTIQARVQSLGEYLANGLKTLQHSNGTPVVKIFGPETFSHRGGNLIMNFYDNKGNHFPLEWIEQKANKALLSIRYGCFCNPGIDEINNAIGSEEISNYFMSHDQGDYYDMIRYLGKMRGAVRVSVGVATVQKDLDAFIELVSSLSNTLSPVAP